MMPPKKSKAARAATENSTEAPKPGKKDGDTHKAMETEDDKVDDDDDMESLPEVNIFKTEVVDGKRQRAAPAGKQMLEDWIGRNLEAKEDVKLPQNEVYTIYLESCIGSNTYAVEQVEFAKAVKQKFPKGYAIQAASPYHSVVKERKVKKSEDKPKVKADSLKLKIKDILEDTFKEAKNPAKGLRFFIIKNMIMGKHPALQLDVRPATLLKALQRGVEWGYITLTAGMGQAGSYRLYVEGEEPVEEVKKPKKGKKGEEAEGKDGAKEEGKEGDKEESDKPVENGTAESSEETKEGGVKDDKDGDEKASGDEPLPPRGAKKAAAKASQAKKKGAKKGAKKAPPKKVYRSYVMHGDPQRIEDTFYMAMTYMAEPKEASVSRIKKYILDYYKDDISMDRMKKALQSGMDKGFWEQVSGSGVVTGSYRLLLDEFDPTDDDDLLGMIVNSIMAAHEPKQCSALLLKNYIKEYHPDFKTAEKPFKLKKAIERALNKDIIRRLSGIGSSGSFQLTKTFIPSPTILAGKDTEEEYMESSSEEESSDEDSVVEQGYRDGFKLSQFKDAYQPRPSKRRGHGRNASLGSDAPRALAPIKGRFRPTASRVVKPKASKQTKRAATKRKYADTSSEEESSSSEDSEDSEEEVKPKVKKSPAKKGRPSVKKTPQKSPASGRGRGRPSKSQYQEVSSDEEEEDVKPRGKKTPTKRGRPSSAKKSTPGSHKAKTPSKVSYQEVSSEEEEEEEKPKGKKTTPGKRGRTSGSKKTPQKASPGRLSFERVSYKEDSSEDEETYTPTPSSSRGGKSPAKQTPKSPAARKQLVKPRGGKKNSIEYVSSDEEEEEPVNVTPPQTKTKAAAKQAVAKAKAAKRRRPKKR